MATKELTITCAKETVELGFGIATFVKDVKAAMADGWDGLTDIPVVVIAALRDLVPALQGAEAIRAEVADDKAAFVNACVLTGSAIVAAVTK